MSEPRSFLDVTGVTGLTDVTDVTGVTGVTDRPHGSAASRPPRRKDARRDVVSRPGLAFLAALALALAAAGRTDAASIFMKNGYILQGPVVERGEETLVLGYPNGRVFLAKRFIESVAYDPGEEKRLVEEESLKKQLAAEVGESRLESLTSMDDVVELPSTLEELMRSYSAPDRGASSGSASTDPGTVTALSQVPGVDPFPPSDGGPVPVAVVVPRPDDQLGERYPDPTRGLSLQPPRSWTVQPTDAALILSGRSAPGALPPSINVLVLSRGAMSPEEYAEQLKKENAQGLEGYELVREGPRNIGSRTAYEVVGKGSFRGKTAFVRQILVMDADQVWLLSSFTPEADDQGRALALTEEVLGSVQFSSR